ncbi:MAG TPA: 50S ribosomal protein L25 [Candidatus Eisenbergiella pullistercoris]|uniref:Large ribosomal subunit protein bL25 n=1 Tax=Candidatus Eisenbergiella pullistercoris TaxID=2838555 RepID=A0A9D2C7T9_9FIRM|nr:50S ribosomal protein L25 [Candidatus Eisenbergiella pullistercoris]
MNTLKAEKRSMDVKAKRLRREGYVTGNVFGKKIEGSIPVKIDRNALERFLKTSGKGSRVQLDVDGENMDVLIKEIDINHLKNEVVEIDFQALVSGEMIHSVAEIILLNHDKVAEGIVEQHLNEISYRALPSALVEKVEVDVAEMKVGDSIKVKDLPIASDKDVHLMTDPEAVVVSVGLAHNAPIDEPAEGEEEAAAEA